MKRSLLFFLLVFLASLAFSQGVYTPTLKFPDNNANFQMPNVTCSWYAISGSLNLHYQFQLDSAMAFNSPAKVDTTVLLITGYTTHELLFGKKYYWRVRAIDGQTSSWSTIWNFTVFNTVELNKPDANATDQDPNVTVSWSNQISTPAKKNITGITHYDYQIDTDSAFNTPNLIQGTKPYTILSVATLNLKFGQKYFWRVRAHHHLGYSAYCPSRAFTVIDNFTLQTPANNATKVFLNAQLKWKNVNGLLAYEYQIAEDVNFTNVIATSEVDTNFTTASFLKFGQQYFWRIRGRHQLDTSSWSNPYAFTSINTVDLKQPGNNQQNINFKPILQWNKQTGIIGYELQLDSLQSFANPVVKFKPGANDIQYQVSKSLLPGKNYYWKMRAFANAGLTADTSDWSPVWSFTTTTTTGISANNAPILSIYPNPATTKIFLKIDLQESSPVTVEIIDLLGKKQIEKSYELNAGQNVKEISLDNIQKGIYIAHIRIGSISVNRKVIVEK